MSEIESKNTYNEQLSANTLFHFTKKFEWLVKIVRCKFKPRLVLENYDSMGFVNMKFAAPMVCYCDIRLSQIYSHMEEYGYFGIGLTKEWGIKNGLNPLLYVPSGNSSLLKTYQEFFTRDNKNYNEIMKLLFYLKPYRGPQYNEKAKEERIRNFYNEREWRYLYFEESDFWPIKEDEYNCVEKRDLINASLQQVDGMNFEISDIRYILVESDEQKDEIGRIMSDVFDIHEKDIYKNIYILTKNMIEYDL